MYVKLVKYRHVLHDNTNLLFDTVIIRPHFFTHYPYTSPVKLQKSQHTVDRCRLPASVWPEKSEDLSLLYVKIQVVKRHQSSISLYQIFYLNHFILPVLHVPEFFYPRPFRLPEAQPPAP